MAMLIASKNCTCHRVRIGGNGTPHFSATTNRPAIDAVNAAQNTPSATVPAIIAITGRAAVQYMAGARGPPL